MHHYHIDRQQVKGWFFGPWNSAVPVPIGYATQGIDQPHYHEQLFEIYLVAQGWSTVVLEGEEHTLRQGDVLVVEPKEVHTFAACSADYVHFVVHAPFVPGDKVVIGQVDK